MLLSSNSGCPLSRIVNKKEAIKWVGEVAQHSQAGSHCPIKWRGERSDVLKGSRKLDTFKDSHGEEMQRS